MKIVIVGAGGIGSCLIRFLAEEHHEITVIDTKPRIVESITDKYDVNGICGSGASYSVLKKVGMEAVDVFLAITSSDEANIMACMIAKELGAGHTVARVRGREYLEDVDVFREKVGIDHIINPELDVAKEIQRLLQMPMAVNVQSFMDGNVLLAEQNITEHHPMAGLSLIDVHRKFGISMLVATVTRDKKAFVPRGDFVLQPGDKISILAQSQQMEKLLEQLKVVQRTVKRVMMVGCGSIGLYLGELLQRSEMKLKIVEFDKERCLELWSSIRNGVWNWHACFPTCPSLTATVSKRRSWRRRASRSATPAFPSPVRTTATWSFPCSRGLWAFRRSSQRS